MNFLHPAALLLLLPVAIFAFWRLRLASSQALAFSSIAIFENEKRTWRQRILPLLPWLQIAALTLIVIALATPQRIRLVASPPHEGVAMELVVDLSSSMNSHMMLNGKQTNRMAVTREVVKDFVKGKGKLKGRPNDLIGLITFARFADTICPLTLSHGPLLYQISKLTETENANEDGTAIGDALMLAAARLHLADKRSQTDTHGFTIKSKVIVLLTDGQNNCGRTMPLEAAALAKKWGIRIDTIGITDAIDEQTVQTNAGAVNFSQATDPALVALERIAKMTGGIFHNATDGNALKKIYAKIDRLEKSPIRNGHIRMETPFFQPFAISALALIFLQTLLQTTWLRRTP